jgi:hypothetical protein
MEGFMNYAIEMGSGVMIYTLSFMKIGSTIQKLIGAGIHRPTDSNYVVISLLLLKKQGKQAKNRTHQEN